MLEKSQNRITSFSRTTMHSRFKAGLHMIMIHRWLKIDGGTRCSNRSCSHNQGCTIWQPTSWCSRNNESLTTLRLMLQQTWRRQPPITYWADARPQVCMSARHVCRIMFYCTRALLKQEKECGGGALTRWLFRVGEARNFSSCHKCIISMMCVMRATGSVLSFRFGYSWITDNREIVIAHTIRGRRHCKLWHSWLITYHRRQSHLATITLVE